MFTVHMRIIIFCALVNISNYRRQVYIVALHSSTM